MSLKDKGNFRSLPHLSPISLSEAERAVYLQAWDAHVAALQAE